MNSYQLRKYQGPLMILAALLVYRFFFANKDDEGDEESTNEGYTTDIANSSPIVKPQPKEKNTYTWYYIGNKGGAIKKIQLRCNMIIEMCKTASKSPDFGNNLITVDKERYKKIASWEKLKVDGDFGNKTGALVKYLTGKNNTSLATVRDRYTAIHRKLYN